MIEMTGREHRAQGALLHTWARCWGQLQCPQQVFLDGAAQVPRPLGDRPERVDLSPSQLARSPSVPQTPQPA
jgi:hypothetical protein